MLRNGVRPVDDKIALSIGYGETMTRIRVTFEADLTSADMRPEDVRAWVTSPGAVKLDSVTSSGSIEGSITIPGTTKECYVTLPSELLVVSAALAKR